MNAPLKRIILSLSSRDYRQLKKLGNQISLKVVFGILGSSFLLATGISLVAAYFLDPVKSVTEKKRTAAPVSASSVKLQPTVVLQQKNVDTILNRNIFNSSGELGDAEGKPKDDPTAGAADISKSGLPLRLVGLIFPGSPFNGLAMLENTQRKTINSLVVGDVVDPDYGFFLEKIYEDRIIINKDGRREFIPLEEVELDFNRRGKKTAADAKPKSDAIAPLAKGPPPEKYKEDGFERNGSAITVSETYKQGLLSGANMVKVLQDAKAEPYMVNGQLVGWKLTRIREDSIYLKMGLQSGDVIEEINGVKLNDAGRSISYLNQLKTEKDFEVRGRRGSTPFTINMSVR
ncbi:MAG: type II secretion system protein N [Oligoflexales bacterium]